MDDLLITLQNRIRDGTISLEDAYQLTAPTGKPVGFPAEKNYDLEYHYFRKVYGKYGR